MEDDEDQEFSLLKYDPPIRIAKKSDRKVSTTKPVSPIFEESSEQLSAEEKKETEQTREILDSIFPPKRIEKNGRSYVVHVSCTIDGKLDLQTLQDRLDAELLKETSEDIGLSLTRRKLFEQCFDELIRQIIITNRDRGWLLRRIKDEFEMTLAAAQSLQESAVAYGVRKSVENHWCILEAENELAIIKEEKQELENHISRTIERCEEAERRVKEQTEKDEGIHLEEMEALRKSNEELKSQLLGIISIQNPETEEPYND